VGTRAGRRRRARIGGRRQVEVPELPVFDDVSNLQMVGFHAAAAQGAEPVMLLDDVNRALIEAVTAARQRAASAVEIDGNGNRDVAILEEPNAQSNAAALARIPAAGVESPITNTRRE
jgi:hypothetical protein